MSGGVSGLTNFEGFRPDLDFPMSTPAAPPATNESAAPRSSTPLGVPTSDAWTVRTNMTAAPVPPQPSRAESMPVLRVGAKGESVRELQTALNAFRKGIGLKEMQVDGSFGKRTEDALVEFQKMWGLDADGIAGRGTWRRLLGEPNPNLKTPPEGGVQAKVLAHRDEILAASEKYGIPPAIIAGMIQVESGGEADVVGVTGDKGLMQINPKAHPSFFRDAEAWKDPAKSLDYGVKLLKSNLDAFSGDLDKALAAYNAGVNGVRNGLRSGKTLDEITYIPNYVSGIEHGARKYADYF